MAVLGCDPPLNVGCLVEAGQGNAGSRNLDTQENIDFVPTYQGTCKNLLLGYDCLGLVSFDNDQELSLIGKGSIQVRWPNSTKETENFWTTCQSERKLL